MGKSHFKSHIIGYDGTQNIASINNITALGEISGVGELSAAHIKIGTNKYIFATAQTTAATLEAEATAYAKASLDATLITGSIALGAGAIWYFTNSSTATKVAAI